MKAKTDYLIIIILLFTSFESFATTYYINPKFGDDKNSGVSEITPFKSLEKASTVNLIAGDKVLLAAGYTFYETLMLQNVRGTASEPIIISSYCSGNELEDKRAIIDAKGYLNGIHLENCSFVEVSNLIITANAGGLILEEKKEKNMRCGVLVDYKTAGTFEHIYLNNLLIKDVFFEDKGFSRDKDEVKTANGQQNYGWGIRFIKKNRNTLLKDVKINACVVKNISHTGIKLTGRKNKNKEYGIQNVEIGNNRVIGCGGPGIQMSGVYKGNIRNNYINKSGSNNDSRKWGRGSGLWTWGSSDILIEKNYFLNANGPGDSAGAHIDFNCKNVIMQYNFSVNNAGGFCEILGNTYNCSYRYNVSVNDGYREKDKNDAFQEGKTFWLSGFQGSKKERKGPFNSYFYNNTIFVKKDIIAKIAVDKAASGVLIANNIFYVEGKSKLVMGDQYKPDRGGKSKVKNIVFKNNLYLHKTNWPKDILIQDSKMIIGDPQFLNKGDYKITGYIPTNEELIKDKGIEIQKIPDDKIGLFIGLKPKYDILGNEIKGLPDMGAIEMTN
jgi:hypothetical protein